MCLHIQVFPREAQLMLVVSAFLSVSAPFILKSNPVWVTNYIVTLILGGGQCRGRKRMQVCVKILLKRNHTATVS